MLSTTTMFKGEWQSKLQNDNVFVNGQIMAFEDATGRKGRKGYDKCIVVDNEIIHVCSKQYGMLHNEHFFSRVEEGLINSDITYATRSINRDNRTFAVDYILDDERYAVNVKQSKDIIRPMLRFVNSYDGSQKTTGHLGFFRQICSNGLHIAEQKIGFRVKHSGDIVEVVMPRIDELVEQFMDNEYYELQRKFVALADEEISDMQKFVRDICKETKIFQFDASETNTDPSKNARMVLEIMQSESAILKVKPNKWIGFNAFNQVLHSKLKKTFSVQQDVDASLFDTVLSY